MSAPGHTAGLDVEQEVDVRRYGGLLLARWWLVLAGLVAGVLVGYVLALGGGSVWQAEALVQLGQPFSPTGSTPVNSYATNPRAVNEIVRAEWALKEAARAAHMRVGALRGHVSVTQVGVQTGAGTRTGAPLIALQVTGASATKTEDAANKLAQVAVEATTAKYVGQKITTFKAELAGIQDQLNTLVPRIDLLQKEVADPHLQPLDRLTLASELDNAQQRRGQLLDLQTTTTQLLALAQNVESATVVEPAAAVKSTARSKRTSMVVGGLIGLIIGALAAILWEPLTARLARAR